MTNSPLAASTVTKQAEEFVVPVYADFLDKFAVLPFSSKHREKYLVYATPADLKIDIGRLFLGHS